MATVNKDFKIKSGLIVEGTNAKVNGNQILTENASDQYILDLIGGETLVKSVSGNLSVDNAGDLSIDQEGLFDTLVSDGLATSSSVSDAISTEVTDRNNAIATAKGEAISDAADYTNGEISTALTTAQGYADDAETAANSHTDSAISTEVTNRNNAIDSAISTEVTNRDSAISSALTTAQGYADTAEQDAKDYADALINDASTSSTEVWSAYKTSTEIGLAQAAAEQHADEAVASLVGSAPELLDTIQELATALENNPDIIADLENVAAGKQDTLTAGNGIVIDNDDIIYIPTSLGSGISVTPEEVSIDRTTVDAWYDENGAAADAQAAAEATASADATSKANAAQAAAEATASADATSKANAAQSAAEATASADATSKANAAEANAIAHADALTTDDVAEGEVNEYFTDSRAKTSAADLLTGATLSNIIITGTGAGLTITAENGVAGSTTDDLVEGETNLYFQDERAFDAVSNTNIRFETVEITYYRREEATWTNIATASQAVCHQAGSNIGSMKYLVRTTAMVGGTRQSHVTELLATVDGSNGVALVEYGTIYTSENPLATATVLWNGLTNCYELNVTTANNNSEVMVAATLISAVD